MMLLHIVNMKRKQIKEWSTIVLLRFCIGINAEEKECMKTTIMIELAANGHMSRNFLILIIFGAK